MIDFSTIAPATSQALAERLAGQGVAYLDAPVTGGTEGARAGTLSVLVGGASADLELPLSRLVAAMEDELLAAGHGDDDVSALARWFEQNAGP